MGKYESRSVIKDSKNKPEFNYDCITQIPGVHPSAKKYADFDWEALSVLLGEATEDLSERDFSALASAFHEILAWVIKGDKLDLIGRRTVALAWMLDPNLFEGKSAASLAKKMGIHKERLSECVSESSRRFGIRNSSQKHGWNFKPN